MRKLLLFVFAALAFTACEQAPIEEQSVIRQDAPDTITVGFEGDDETRIQLNEAQKTVWTKGDQVSVFYKSYDNLKFEFEGNTGDRNGTLKRVGGNHNGQTMDDVVVVYPYSADYMITLSEGCVNATIPSTQTYLKDSYGVGDNLMIARSSFNQFSLKSVCGWLKIQLTGAGEVIERITFRGNDGEQVAGLVYVDATTAEATLATAKHNSDDNSQLDGTLVLDDSIYTEVVLDCGEGVTLGKNATAFYIALPPQTYEKGFTVVIEDTEGYIMEQSTDKALLIERNTIKPMAALEFINPNSPTKPTQPAPASNEIWYTATEKADPYFDDFVTFGADVVSNVWDSETKRGIITFDGDVTMIGESAFDNCDKFIGITLPESVTLIGIKAFYDCDGLTEFTIPDSVTAIGFQAFEECDSLTSVTIPDSVTTIGEGAFRGCYRLTSVTIPDSVTMIGSSAFEYCASLTSVNIPDSVTTIGGYAFYSCNSLTSVTIGDSVTTIGIYAFKYCDNLTSVTIGDSVTTIGYHAFENCTSLKEFTGKFAEDNGRILVVDGVLTAFAPAGITEYNIPDSVTKIGYGAFASCYSLTSVNIPDSVTTIGDYAFNICTSLKKVYCYATIPPSLGGSAFSRNASGRRIHVYEECVELYKSAWSDYKDSIYTNGQNCPETTTIEYTTNDGNIVTTKNMLVVSNIYENGVGTLVVVGKIALIPKDAFRDCTSLTSVNIPDSVTTIGEGAFTECTSLTSVNIPDSVTSIGERAFYYCDSLTSVTIPDSVTTIGEGAFRECTNLTSVTIGDSVTTIGEAAFAICTSLTSVTIGDSVTTIGDGAFSSCYSLTSVTIGDSVTTIGDGAFSSCYSLTSVNIPDSVTEIGSWAFEECDSLTSVTIGNRVTTIGGGAFLACTSLKSVYCKATTPPVLGGTDVFDSNGSGRKIYVPAGSVNAYKSATNWSEYASDIVGYNF